MKKSLLILCCCIIAAIFSGCASYQVNRDSSGKILNVQTTGFLRTVKVMEHKKYDSTGKIVLEEKLSVETSSNTGEVMKEGNKLLGTAVGVARDLMP